MTVHPKDVFLWENVQKSVFFAFVENFSYWYFVLSSLLNFNVINSVLKFY